MKVLQYIYNGKNIDFSVENENVMINATQMAQAFDKKVGHFLENETTQNFIRECLNNRISDYLKIYKKEDLIISKQKTGTWMHRLLALKFAAWLDVGFELWVYTTIDQLVLGHFKELKDATQQKIIA